MNVKEDVKLSMKLFKLVFFIFMYVHCLACGWYFFAARDKKWIPPLMYLEDDQYIYDEDTLKRYLFSVYHASLILTLNDIAPVTNAQVAFCATFLVLSAIINANIFGTMALIVQALNRKFTAF